MTLRRSCQTFRTCLTLSIMAVVSAIAIQAQAGEASTPGLVKDMPASGRFVKTDKGYMVPYESTIPGSDVTFTMVPIPGGKFMLGSPASEKGRNDDEGPQVEVVVEPFWMGQTETSWAEYKRYMALHDVFKAFQSKGIRQVTKENQADAITAPSNLYDTTFTYGSGDDPQQPAVTMTQYAAKQYTKWLSAVTEHFYRLPSEAEWEYACRAGTKTAYYFGDDDSKLDEHAWYYDNSDDRTHKVAQKKPNPWGLYDMHGNVAEWTLDQHVAEHYKKLAGKSVKAADATAWPTQIEDRVLRGGTWEFDPEDIRAASRLASSDEDWKDEDPNIPLSPWWYTTSPATGVGFRIIRPLDPPKDQKSRNRYWKADIPEIAEDVEYRIESEGRGALGIVDKMLPEAIKKLGQ
jgi:sulfatase modifying factor 1